MKDAYEKIYITSTVLSFFKLSNYLDIIHNQL